MRQKPNGIAGAAIALVAILLPTFLMVVGALPFLSALRARAGVQGALRGINVTVAGLLLAALYHPVWTSAMKTSADVALGPLSKGELMLKNSGLALVVVGFFLAHVVWLAGEVPVVRAAEDAAEIAKLKAEIEQLKGRLPSQSHAMMDVDYHFANLWFAAQAKNWPLAEFYLSETRSHLRWAVRIIPVRRAAGGEVDLRGLLEALDSAGLTEIGKAIGDRNSGAFAVGYRHTLEGCYSCHKAADKPYLRPRIPEQPQSRIINFDPSAAWP